ncbi:MAG: sigma 54-dependent Fis family transcriptional regulator [Deltaproteobacteria bacterium]|nr:sigma 54-dependent Fis family transcriptional regulator [Deltaproteobacteria bacterium]
MTGHDPRKTGLDAEPDWERESTIRDPGREESMLVRQARLRVVEGAEKDREIVIGEERATVGRAEGNSLRLTDRLVSAIHVEIVNEAGGYRLRDLDSTNGTYLGASRVTDAFLGPDALVRVGDTVLHFSPLPKMVPVALSAERQFGQLVGASAGMRRMFALLEKVAPSDLTVLIEGETGTGKEEIARALHERSGRAKEPFVVLDCSAIPQGLAEGMVMGYERGAFTGADRRHIGAFESAHGGTIFLDEIGEMHTGLQPKLLRVLESRLVVRLGEHQPRRVDVRVIAATNRDLPRMINEGRFRADLYYRLAEVHVRVPPLRERPGDVELLAAHFLERASVRCSAKMARVGKAALERLERHAWPGNVRELRNLMERCAMLSPGQQIDADQIGRELRFASVPRALPLDARLPYKDAKEEALRQFDAYYLTELHGRCGGNLSKAAREAGLARHHLRSLFRKAGIIFRD